MLTRWGLGWPDAPGVLAGLALDRILGDPPDPLHPVAWFGSLMARREQMAWRDSRVGGAAHAASGAALGAGTGGALLALGRSLPWGQSVATAVMVAIVVGGRSLDRAAAAVRAALDDDDVVEARRLLPGLVGRDPSSLDSAEVARAVVESVAENTVDAVIAPAVWATVAGPAGAGAYRALNTLDAMVGHRSDRYCRFGWASARADDIANLVPARLGALLVALVRPRRAGAVWAAVRRDAPAHPSPNAGIIEAAFAAALDLRLGGTNIYDDRAEARGVLGNGAPPSSADIDRARALARDVTVALAVGLGALGAGLGGVRAGLSTRGQSQRPGTRPPVDYPAPPARRGGR